MQLVVLPWHSTRPPSTARSSTFAQVDGPVLQLPPLGTALRPSPGEPPVHPTAPLVATLPIQRRLGPDDVERAVKLYAEGRSADWVAAELWVAPSTVRRALKDAGVTLRPRGRQPIAGR